MPDESLDYMEPLYSVGVDINLTKEPHTDLSPIITTAKLHMRDELIMDRMYGL